jgi:hypothetical protein
MRAFCMTILFGLSCLSAPHPGTGSSLVSQLSQSVAFSQMGFKLTGLPSGWSFTTSQIDHKNKDLQIEISKATSLTNDYLGRVSFKAETTKTKVDLEAYVKKYLRDYNQYGFDVSGLQSLRDKNIVIVDINQKNKKTRSRQMFFQNATRIVVATCIDEFENFDKTVLECNQIFSGLSWR